MDRKELDLKLYKARMEAQHTLVGVLNREVVEMQFAAYQLGVDEHYSDFCLVNTISANVDNDKLSDADFRQFIRNSIAGRK